MPPHGDPIERDPRDGWRLGSARELGSGRGLRSAREHAVALTALFTLFALAAFAANSILCRLALGHHAIDAAGFTTIRLVSGALALFLLETLRRGARAPAERPPAEAGVGSRPHAGSWTSAFLLFLYALPFSLAYVSLGVATGALILFLSVQATMLAGALLTGERIHWLEWLGIAAALSGLVYLVAPGLSAPDPAGALLMVIAGAAWGIYSLRGRRSTDPIRDTASNFVRSVPFALIAGAAGAVLAGAHPTGRGFLLAAASGVIASGAGYAAWFAALRHLKVLHAAALQLAVPVIAAAGGILFLAEPITLRLVVAAGLILGGVCFALSGRALRARRVADANNGISPVMR